MRKKDLEKVFTLIIALNMFGCGWIKKSSKSDSNGDANPAVETQEASEEVESEGVAEDSFGFLLFDENVMATSGWENDQVQYSPNYETDDANTAQAKSVVSTCMALPQDEVGIDIGFTTEAANAVCSSDAKKLDLAWKSETLTNQ